MKRPSSRLAGTPVEAQAYEDEFWGHLGHGKALPA
jgi:hypothetical protein